jgi:hypothetical protein
MYLIYIITILLIFIALILCLEASQFSYDLNNDQIFSVLNDRFEYTVIDEAFNSVCAKPCIFNPFIKVFSNTFYYPSCFLPSETRVGIEDLNLLEYIYFKQFNILDNNSNLFTQYVNNTELLKYDLNAIITEYLSTIK